MDWMFNQGIMDAQLDKIEDQFGNIITTMMKGLSFCYHFLRHRQNDAAVLICYAYLDALKLELVMIVRNQAMVDMMGEDPETSEKRSHICDSIADIQKAIKKVQDFVDATYR